jgi:RNA polymerase sigma factor (sigma-70 family)
MVIAHPTGRTTPSDEDLVADLARDEEGRAERALGALYRRFAPVILRMAARSLDDAAAADVLQDVFVGVWRSASTFDPERGPARAWILQTASNRIANELRRRRRRPADGDANLDELPQDSDGPAEAALAAHRRAVVRTAFAALPAPQQQALALAFFDDLTHQQVAAALGLPLGTAKTRIRTALASLRRHLAPIAASLGVLLVLSGIYLTRTRSQLALDERALALVTASDAQNLRLAPLTPASPETHARYRGRAGTALAVVTLTRFPGAPTGERYVVWVRHGERWLALGSLTPDAGGAARAVFAQPDLATLPDEIVVTRERGATGEAPGGTPVVAWPER